MRKLSTQEVDAFLVVSFSHLFVLCIAFPCSMETVPEQKEERHPSCMSSVSMMDNIDPTYQTKRGEERCVIQTHMEKSCDGQPSRYVGLRRLSTQEVGAFLVLSFSHLFVLYLTAFPCSTVFRPCPDRRTRRGIPRVICVYDGQHRPNT